VPELTIHIPAAIDPIDRGELFEDPILDALGAAGIASDYLGGGSALSEVDGRMAITGVDIELEVGDLKRALDIICRVLRTAGAPPATTITQFEPEEIVHHLGEGA
jgi:hypothetical protein